MFPAEKADAALLCEKGGHVLLAMLCVEFFSAAASSDPEMMNCKKEEVGGEGWGEMGEAAGRGAERKITF